MCTLAAYVRVFPRYPIILAANRDELLARASKPPGRISERVFGGIDEAAGGTWLGVNDSGVVAALLNRRSAEAPDPTRRSRGLLCLDGLAHGTADEAHGAVLREPATAYNPFNLFLADRRSAWVVSPREGQLASLWLEPGLHLLTNLDVDDPECPRIASSHRLFAELLAADAPPPAHRDFIDRLRRILSHHEVPLDPRGPLEGNSLCLHLGEYGTRSSTIVFLDDEGEWSYWHADASPCRAPYEPLDVIGALG